MIKAGRLFFEKLSDVLDLRQSIVVETTLSGTYINKVALRAKQNGYKITTIYLFGSDPKICLDRVKSRIRKGGHDVPDEDVERRFYRSFENFWNNFKSLSDEWLLTYNGDLGFQQVAVGETEILSVENEILFSLFLAILKDYANSK